MSKAWEIFKESLPIYLCQSDKSLYLKEDNIIIAKSGVNNFTCNFIVIENEDSNIQKKIINDNFKEDGLIFSLPQYKSSIDSWSESLGFKYLGKAPVMNKKQNKDEAHLKHYDNIKIERVTGGKALKDFIEIFSQTRNISVDDAQSMFLNLMFTSTYFVYVAYYLDEPAGIFIGINVGNSAITVDVDVKESLRKLEILKILADRVAYETSQLGILDYSCIITSPFAYNVVMKHGYSIEQHCDIWRRGEVNG